MLHLGKFSAVAMLWCVSVSATRLRGVHFNISLIPQCAVSRLTDGWADVLTQRVSRKKKHQDAFDVFLRSYNACVVTSERFLYQSHE